jgi:hypothetical protein
MLSSLKACCEPCLAGPKRSSAGSSACADVQVFAEMVDSAAITLMDRLAFRLGVETGTLFPAYPALKTLLS